MEQHNCRSRQSGKSQNLCQVHSVLDPDLEQNERPLLSHVQGRSLSQDLDLGPTLSLSPTRSLRLGQGQGPGPGLGPDPAQGPGLGLDPDLAQGPGLVQGQCQDLVGQMAPNLAVHEIIVLAGPGKTDGTTMMTGEEGIIGLTGGGIILEEVDLTQVDTEMVHQGGCEVEGAGADLAQDIIGDTTVGLDMVEDQDMPGTGIAGEGQGTGEEHLDMETERSSMIAALIHGRDQEGQGMRQLNSPHEDIDLVRGPSLQ